MDFCDPKSTDSGPISCRFLCAFISLLRRFVVSKLHFNNDCKLNFIIYYINHISIDRHAVVTQRRWARVGM